MKLLFTVFLLVGFLFGVWNLHAQDPMPVSRITGEVNFDGIVNEECWEKIEPMPMVMHTPVFGNTPTEKSEVRIAYNLEYLYLSARLYDSEPDKILITSKKRDEINESNDWLVLILDTFNDNENALMFETTPAGLRTDVTIFNDAIGNYPDLPFNLSWNTFWDVKTTRDKQGWYAEMRIPFTSLRFKETDGKVTMGLICLRYIPHRNEMDVFPAIPPEWGPFSVTRPSKARDIEFTGLTAKKPFYIAPYAIGGYQQEYLLNDEETDYEYGDKPKLSAGLDMKYGLTNNLTLDVTINTDFAQVEADNEQVNLTRFSLFFPEKRTFFQERASIFNFELGQQSNLFYSRRIGLYEGNQVSIYGGARITGMAGKWDIGFLDMQTRAFDSKVDTIADLPSENFGILRLRRNVINENSYIGGIMTTRLGVDGTYNVSYGVDGIFKIFSNDYINIKWSQVIDESLGSNLLSMDPSNIYLNWKRFTDKGFGYDFTYSRSGKDFQPEMGFMMRENYALYAARLKYGWLPGEASPLISHGIEFNNMVFTDNVTGDIQSYEGMLIYGFNTKSSFMGMVGLGRQYEDVADTFDLSDDVVVPSGKYGFNVIESHINTPGSKRLSAMIDIWAGGFYDGTRFSIGLQPKWNISPSLQLGLAYEYNKIDFSDRQQHYNSHIARLNTLVMFTTKLSVSAFIQYNSLDNDILTNVRIRYNPREGNDLYVVFNEGRNTNLNRETPKLPAFYNRAVMVKYTYTFVL
jgi:opacity protein-like surface antigen